MADHRAHSRSFAPLLLAAVATSAAGCRSIEDLEPRSRDSTVVQIGKGIVYVPAVAMAVGALAALSIIHASATRAATDWEFERQYGIPPRDDGLGMRRPILAEYR